MGIKQQRMLINKSNSKRVLDAQLKQKNFNNEKF